MEVTRQLRLDKLTQKGLAHIHLTFTWDGQRLRLASGEKCAPAHWNATRQQVKDKPGAYALTINTVLENWTTAAHAAHHDARVRGQRWPADQMEQEIRRRYEQLSSGIDQRSDPVGLPPLEQPAPDVLELMEQWIDYQRGKVSLRTGRPLTKTFIRALGRTRTKLQEFSQRTKTPLRFADMNQVFYAAFQKFILETLGHDVNTLGSHMKKIRSFLRWCEQRDIAVNGRYRDFKAPDVYRGVDALTQAELLQLAAVDLTTPAVRAYVAEHFPVFTGSYVRGPLPLTVDDHWQRLQYARDKLLQCCYFGLRLGDANRLAPEHLHGEVVRIRANKTGVLCVIPYFDDDVFRPVGLVAQYAHLKLATCLPTVRDIHEYLPHVQHLAGLTRLKLITRLGRKTFATLKIYQGIPKAQVMLATGHRTERQFNRYLGIDEQELVESYRKTARRVG